MVCRDGRRKVVGVWLRHVVVFERYGSRIPRDWLSGSACPPFLHIERCWVGLLYTEI